MTRADPPRSHLSGCVKKLSSISVKKPEIKNPAFAGPREKALINGRTPKLPEPHARRTFPLRDEYAQDPRGIGLAGFELQTD